MSTGIQISQKSNKDTLLLCSFSHGLPTSGDITFKFLANTSDSKKAHQRAVIADSRLTEYTGTNFGADSDLNQSVQYAIGVFNPKKRKVSVMNVDHLFVLRPGVKGIEDAEEEGEVDYYVQRNRVVEAFGSKKRKRALKAQLANRVHLEAGGVAVESLNDALAAIPEAEAAMASRITAPSATGILPPHDLETQRNNKIYATGRWLPKGIGYTFFIELVNSASKSSVEWKEARTSQPDIVFACLELLHAKRTRQASDADQANSLKIKKLCKLAVYLSFLVQLQRSGKGKNAILETIEALETPPSVKAHLKSTFLQREGRRLKHTTQMQHRLYCYMCVSLLTICNYAIPSTMPAILAKDAKVTQTKIKDYFREVGATIAKAGDISLKAPLQLPRLRGARKAKAKR